MARPGAALWVALLLAALLVPAASSQPSLPSLAPAYQVIPVDVPLGADGTGSLQVPLAGGILDIRIVPVLLEGSGGQVDVEAYLAEAMLLLPDAAPIPLPSMVVLAEDLAIDGPAGVALAQLAMQVEDLREAILGLEADPADDLMGQLDALQQQIDALAEEAAWVQAFAEEAAGVAGAGAQDQVANALALLAPVEAGIALIQEGLDRLAQDLLEDAPLPSGSPGPSPTGAPSSSLSPSSSPSPSDSPMPDTSEAEQMLLEGIEQAQEEAEEAQAWADLARDALEERAGPVAAEADQRQQSVMDGADWAINLTIARLQEARDFLGESAEAAAEGSFALAEEKRAAAEAEIEAALADLAWAEDWIKEARALAEGMAPGLVPNALASAEAGVASAQGTTNSLLDVVDKYSPVQTGPFADDLQSRLAEAQAALGEAGAALDDAVAFVGDTAGGLDPEDSPVSVDDQDGLLVCLDAASSQVCVAYRSPAETTPVGSVTVLVALPMGDPLEIDLPGSLGSLTDSLTAVPLPPAPTGVPSLTGVPLPTGLPGSSSASASPSASASASPSASASASSSSSASPQAPSLRAVADLDSLAVRMGEQGSILVTVHNDGTMADRVRLTAQHDAPVTLDTPNDVVDIAPGQSAQFTVRVTPLQAGSGTIELLATGEKGGTVKDVVAVSVAAAPDAPASISASLEPSALQGVVGQSLAVTVRLQNNGDVEDNVQVAVSGQGFNAEPAIVQVLLQPAESVVREVRITATEAGPLEVVMGITSDRGADLQPMVLLKANDALAAAEGDDPGRDGKAPSVKDTPALGPLAIGAAVAIAFVGIRRRLAK